MSKMMYFLEIVSRNLDENGFVLIENLKEMFSDKSNSYISVNLNSLMKKGLIEKVSVGKWRLVAAQEKNQEPQEPEEKPNKFEVKPKDTGLKSEAQSIKLMSTESKKDLPILVLTPEEKKVLDLLVEVKTKCLDKSNHSRFTEEGVQQILLEKKIPKKEWETLKKKLTALNIIEAKGVGLKGGIYNLDETLLLEYLTNENLVKETLFREERVRENLHNTISEHKKKVLSISDLENEIKMENEKLEAARLEVRKIEDKLIELKKRLNTEFPDKEKIIATQQLLMSIEFMGEEKAIMFIKNILGE